MTSRQLHLAAFMRPVSIHTGAWRYPGACPDANFNFEHLKSFARKLEAAKFDAFFMADHLAQKAGSYAGLAFVGTPASIADSMQEWIEARASDGFVVMFPWVPGGLDDCVERVVPELQRRGLFRREYEGRTLREHLGLRRPSNRFFQ